MDANGKNERQLTALRGAGDVPRLLSRRRLGRASGHRRSTGGVTDLWVVSSAGGVSTRLTDTPDVAERLPVWSPDGATVLYVAAALDNSSAQLWTLDVSSGVRTQLTFDATFKDQTPDWSPDGQVIAYNAGGDIWTMAADGTGQVNLTSTPTVNEFGTAFSPDGAEIAFTGTGGPVPAGELYVQVMAADGSDRRVLVPTPGLQQAVPAWQSLGRL